MRHARMLAAAIAAAVALTGPSDIAASPRGGAAAGAPAPLLRGRFVVVAAGDIACPSRPGRTGDACRYDATARLAEGRGIDAVLALGDNQYDVGALRDYRRYFGPTWGVLGDRIRPVPGNHEYGQDATSTPRGYFRYFGRSSRGPDGLGYYSYNLGRCPDGPCWHVIALSSELCFATGGCGRSAQPHGAGERMFAWLRHDLATHPNDRYPCTLAYWHHPLFSFSTGSGATAAVRPLWRLLIRADADLVLNGHSHNYQRWAPQTAIGVRRASGIREFVVGTGGASHYPLASGPRPAALQAAQAYAFGVLRLALDDGAYRWQWVSAPGQRSFTDASRHPVRCR